MRYQDLGFPGALFNVDRVAQFGTFDLVGQIDTVLDVFVGVVVIFFAIWGLYLLVRSFTRKPEAAAA
jgi:hypothetical protein